MVMSHLFWWFADWQNLFRCSAIEKRRILSLDHLVRYSTYYVIIYNIEDGQRSFARTISVHIINGHLISTLWILLLKYSN